MDEEEFKKTNINTAVVIKLDMEDLKVFKSDMLDLVKKYDGDIIYHTVSPYKLKITQEKQ